MGEHDRDESKTRHRVMDGKDGKDGKWVEIKVDTEEREEDKRQQKKGGQRWTQRGKEDKSGHREKQGGYRGREGGQGRTEGGQGRTQRKRRARVDTEEKKEDKGGGTEGLILQRDITQD